MKMGHRHGEGDRRKGYAFFLPIKWPCTFCCSPVKEEVENGMDHTKFKVLKNGFIHNYTFETY